MTATLDRGGHIKAVQLVPGLHDVQSSALDRVGTRMVLTSRSRSIMAIWGQSGVGKSFATARGAELCASDTDSPAQIVWLTLTTDTQGKPLLRDLFPQITGTDPAQRATARQLESQLMTALADTHRLIVLDEAHLVRPGAMALLRGLHDHPDSDFGLVLVGMPSLMSTLAPEMQTRVQTRVEMTPMADSVIVEILCAYHDVFATADPDLLVMLNRTRARGEFRWWAQFLANVAVRYDVDTVTLTREVAETAAEDQR